MGRNKKQILVFIPIALLLLSSFSHAVEFSVQSSAGECEVTVNSPTNNHLIEDQIEQNCVGATELVVTGLGVKLISTSYCTLLPNLTSIKNIRTSADRFDEDFNENECKFLKKMLFGDNKFTKLPRDGFRAFKNLEVLALSLNELDNLDSNVFMGLEKLTWLALDQNRLTQLPAGLFEPLKNLKYLFLDGNNLRILDFNSIATNAKLKDLFCNACELTTILPSKTALTLDTLQLQANHLTDITALNGLNSLESLELQNNINLTMDGVEFGYFTNLASLNLGNVSLTSESDFQKICPSSLTRLFLYGNYLGTFDLNRLSHLTNLEYLNVVATGLKTLNIEKMPLLFPKMRQIDMRMNDFSKDQSLAMKEYCDSISIICNM